MHASRLARLLIVFMFLGTTSCQNDGPVKPVGPAGQLIQYRLASCYKPNNYEVTSNPGLTVKIKELANLEIKNDQKVGKIMEMSTDAADIDSQAFRLCEDYGNGITDKDTYAKQKEIILAWKKAVDKSK